MRFWFAAASAIAESLSRPLRQNEMESNVELDQAMIEQHESQLFELSQVKSSRPQKMQKDQVGGHDVWDALAVHCNRSALEDRKTSARLHQTGGAIHQQLGIGIGPVVQDGLEGDEVCSLRQCAAA